MVKIKNPDELIYTFIFIATASTLLTTQETNIDTKILQISYSQIECNKHASNFGRIPLNERKQLYGHVTESFEVVASKKVKPS